MSIKEIYEKLLNAKRPIDFFEKVSTEEELKKIYREYAKVLHPDTVSESEQYISSEAFSILGKLYKLGISELEQGIYEKIDPIKLYKNMDPLFDITVKGNTYYFYENVFEGEVAYIYKGICNDDIVYLKIAIDEVDNELIDNEYKVLSTIRHQSLPFVEHKIVINNENAIIMREVKGITMLDLLDEYKSGAPAEHVMWMLERILSVVGYLHSNCVVHGNIKPENIIINKEVHNVSLVGFSFCIKDANTLDAKYKIVNDYYTAPEVSKDARVLPSSDIYSIGKIAIKLLGGSVITNGIPLSVDPRVRTFIKNMVTDDLSKRPNDAWKLWSEVSKLRTEVFGTERFKKMN